MAWYENAARHLARRRERHDALVVSFDEGRAVCHGERVKSVTSNLDCWSAMTIHVVVDQYLPCGVDPRVKSVGVS